MEINFANRYLSKSKEENLVALDRIRRCSMLKTLAKIALDYDKGDAWMLANLFDNIEKVKFIWEYIWLSYTIRSEKSNEQAVFVTGPRLNNYKELCKNFEAACHFIIEEQSKLYDLFHHFIVMDGFSKIRTIAKAATANVEVSPAAKSNEMDIEPAVAPNSSKFVSVHLSATEVMMNTITERGEVFVSKLAEKSITTFEPEKALEKVKEAAGTGLGNEKVCLPHLKFTHEMRITSWVERETNPIDPVVVLPAKIEDLLSDRPPIKCEVFESIHPDNINHETEAIDQAAHFAIEQITLSNSFKE